MAPAEQKYQRLRLNCQRSDAGSEIDSGVLAIPISGIRQAAEACGRPTQRKYLIPDYPGAPALQSSPMIELPRRFAKCIFDRGATGRRVTRDRQALDVRKMRKRIAVLCVKRYLYPNAFRM